MTEAVVFAVLVGLVAIMGYALLDEWRTRERPLSQRFAGLEGVLSEWKAEADASTTKAASSQPVPDMDQIEIGGPGWEEGPTVALQHPKARVLPRKRSGALMVRLEGLVPEDAQLELLTSARGGHVELTAHDVDFEEETMPESVEVEKSSKV